MNILKALDEAGKSANNLEEKYLLYLEAVRSARIKFEELASACEEVINKPHLRIDDFEIDG